MNKVTVVVFGILASSGVALGDSHKAPPGKPDMAKPDMAKPDMAKPDMAKPDMAKPAEAAKKEAPKPPKELADMAKAMAGTWKCSGKSLGEDMKTMADMTGTAKVKLVMDGYWLHVSYDAKMGKMPFHFDSYSTVDAASHQWRRVMVESLGGQSVGTSSGPKDNKMDWELQSIGMMGAGLFRDHEDWTDLKAGYKSWGEMSMDKGKTWVKVYEQTCKK